MTTTLTDTQRRWLKAQAHHLNVIVTVGQNGLTETVLAEVIGSLEHHQLMKVKVAVGDRELRDQIIEKMCKKAKATLIARVGHVAILYKPDEKEPKYPLPKK